MPDLERRSRASFISSKEGGTPSRAILFWMNSSSSTCFFVSIAQSSGGRGLTCSMFVLIHSPAPVNGHDPPARRLGTGASMHDGG